MIRPFDSFNARNLRAQDVAESFIESEDFERICKGCHSIVLGPRGSGKTTLLKILTLPAVSVLAMRKPNGFALPFTAIYIPTDIVWHHQLLYSKDFLEGKDAFNFKISQGAVSTAVMTAIVETFLDRIAFEFPDSKEREIALSEALIRVWGLRPTVPKLSQIYIELKERMLLIGSLLNQALISDVDTLESLLPDWCATRFLDAVDFATAAFDAIFEQDLQSRWALCFDELELAPQWLQEMLFKLPRSTNQKILFKISSSPDPLSGGAPHVNASDDVDVIKLWRASMVKHRAFCRELTISVMKRKGLSQYTPDQLLGPSDIDDVEVCDESDIRPYSEGSPEWKLIRDVASWDASLEDLLRKKGIDPSNPVPTTAKDRDSVLRKIKPIAAFRNKFVKIDEQGELVRRSRRSGGEFYGELAIYDISDGNPRRLIRIIEDICGNVGHEPTKSARVVPKDVQARIVSSIAFLFKDYVEMIPGAHFSPKDGGTPTRLYSLLHEIGRSFSSEILEGKFPLDPKNSFKVDVKVSEEVLRLLRLASYHGAIVKVDSNEAKFSSDLRGSRFRICYTLSPIFYLPLRLYDSVDLSECLKPKHLKFAKGEANSLGQLQFPFQS